VLWLLVLSCSDGDTDTTPATTTLSVLQDHGTVEVCLSSSRGQPPALPDTDIGADTWTVTGILVDKDSHDWGDFLLIPCTAVAQRVFELVDAEGESWYLGWTLIQKNGTFPGLDPQLKKDVEVTATVIRTDGGAALAMVDPDGLAFLVDSEAVTDHMDGSAFPGLGISWSAAYGSAVSGDCAQQESKLVLQGDGTTELYPSDEDDLAIDGQTFHAFAFAIYRDPADDSCERSRAFVLYR
jgi:hypothetical protein